MAASPTRAHLPAKKATTPRPEVLLFRYRIAGVTYDCAQDVSHLAALIAGYRIDQPVQVRYDPRKPRQQHRHQRAVSGLRMQQQRLLLFGADTPARRKK